MPKTHNYVSQCGACRLPEGCFIVSLFNRGCTHTELALTAAALGKIPGALVNKNHGHEYD